MRPVDAEPAVSDEAPRGDAVDFDEVFRCHHDRLLRLTGLLCGDAAWAEDVVAEVFARLFRRWQPGAVRDVDAYLRRAVVNEVAGEFRRRTRARKRVALLAAVPRRSSEDKISERDQLWRAMLGLPGRQRAVLVLRYFEDASEARVAEILEMPVGTVKSTTARGLERLRDILGGNDDDD